jgi:Skp family chaperone for outer membrane proteins
MKKMFFPLLTIAVLFTCNITNAQIKVGVFDIDAMVSAMPDYRAVDSLLNIFQRDTIGGRYQVYLGEYQRLDSTLKFIDSPGLKAGTVPITKVQFDNSQKQQVMNLLLNWRDYAQNLYNNKKAQLSQNLYQQVQASYIRVLQQRKYSVVLKPGAYEFGPRVDNIFIAVAKDLKLTELPQELLVLGVDPDTPDQGAAPPANSGAKPAAPTRPGSH